MRKVIIRISCLVALAVAVASNAAPAGEKRAFADEMTSEIEKARQIYGDIDGVDIRRRGSHIEIGGTVAEPEDFRRIEEMAKKDARVRSKIAISSDVVGASVKAIEGAIRLPGITVRQVRDRIVLEGVAYSAADAKKAVEIAKIYAPDVVDLIDVKGSGRSVAEAKMIALEFHMMEVKKEALKTFGIQWAPGAFPAGQGSGAMAAGGDAMMGGLGELGRSLVGFVLNLLPRIKNVNERGAGRVLENSSVIVKSGETAKLFSGSEIPFYNGNDVNFKKVGIDITAEPINAAGGIDIKLSAALSSASADIRGSIDTNTVSTSVVCRDGESVVLANIVRNGDVKMKNRVPKDLDTSTALFTLIKSKDFQSNRSVFLLFVTPRVVDRAAAAAAELERFAETELKMVRDRSKEEYEEMVARSGGAVTDKEARPRKRKWR